jgi:quinol monooxygenase YgiN
MMISELHGLSGLIEDLRELLAELAAASREEEGCESFRVLAGENPAELVVLSSWRGEPALQAHFKTPHYTRYRTLVGPLLARPSDVLVLHVAETIHAIDPNPPDPDRFD